jgi:hypothetical protein
LKSGLWRVITEEEIESAAEGNIFSRQEWDQQNPSLFVIIICNLKIVEIPLGVGIFCCSLMEEVEGVCR